tara:strand:+ start:887 stop:1465 length:579 start_codon:yes stop_codon:yes gene_type:complete
MSIEYYNNNADRFYQDTLKLDMENIYENFLKYIPKGGKILDAGCGSGRDIKAFTNYGYQVEAFDASSEMVKRACAYTKQKVYLLNFNEVDWINKFDGIWACASLLHVEEDDFKGIGKRLYNALKANSPFYLSFKYGYKNYYKDSRFFQCHDENSLEKAMKTIGSFTNQYLWLTEDVRVNRKNEKWLNAIYIK